MLAALIERCGHRGEIDTHRAAFLAQLERGIDDDVEPTLPVALRVRNFEIGEALEIAVPE